MKSAEAWVKGRKTSDGMRCGWDSYLCECDDSRSSIPTALSCDICSVWLVRHIQVNVLRWAVKQMLPVVNREDCEVLIRKVKELARREP